MAKKSSMTFVEDFAFYEQLWNYYASNRGKIRSRYNDLTKKFLAYNDRNENPDAFLRTPQFEALEMYVFIKEFMNNAHMFQMFDDWRNHRDKFSDVSYYTIAAANNEAPTAATPSQGSISILPASLLASSSISTYFSGPPATFASFDNSA